MPSLGPVPHVMLPSLPVARNLVLLPRAARFPCACTSKNQGSVQMTDSARFSWTVLLPVKVLARAKSRLAVLAGDRRGDLALALASDTVTAVLACPEVARVVVVTSDPVAGPLLAALGAIVVADEPADRSDPGGEVGPLNGTPAHADPGVQDMLNAALRHGATVAARRWPGT